jgi:hypothetical protein
MKERRPSHTLHSFTAYVNKVFHFRQALPSLHDARQDPEIPPATVFQALFHAFVFRSRSFQELEEDLARPQFQQQIGAPRAFGDDVLRYSLVGFALQPLEDLLVTINRRLKRNKAFEPGRVQGHIVAALDGIEILSSYSRCCEECSERRVTFNGPDGQPVENIQYYHRAVGCQIISSPVKSFLGIEWVKPGEGEDKAALRLLTHLVDVYGSRFFDILLLDSLYAQAPVLKLAQEIGWGLVVTLKQENRDLYQDAMGLFSNRPADESFTVENPDEKREVELWSEASLPFTKDFSEPVRVVRSKELITKNHYRRGKLRAEATPSQWMWIDTLNAQVFSPRLVRQLGHSRWKQENNGWRDLAVNWALKHGFLHACKHRPKQPTPNDPAHLVPNRGLAAVTLILLLAFTLCSAFCVLHSKLVRLYKTAFREVGRELYFSLGQLPQSSARAP